MPHAGRAWDGTLWVSPPASVQSWGECLPWTAAAPTKPTPPLSSFQSQQASDFSKCFSFWSLHHDLSPTSVILNLSVVLNLRPLSLLIHRVGFRTEHIDWATSLHFTSCSLMEILVWGMVTLPHLYLVIFYVSVDALVFVLLCEFKSSTIMICFVAQDVPAVAIRNSFWLGPFFFWQVPFFNWIFFLFLTPENVPGSSCLVLIPVLESSTFP